MYWRITQIAERKKVFFALPSSGLGVWCGDDGSRRYRVQWHCRRVLDICVQEFFIYRKRAERGDQRECHISQHERMLGREREEVDISLWLKMISLMHVMFTCDEAVIGGSRAIAGKKSWWQKRASSLSCHFMCESRLSLVTKKSLFFFVKNFPLIFIPAKTIVFIS